MTKIRFKVLVLATGIMAMATVSIAADNKNIFTRRFIRSIGNLGQAKGYQANLERAREAAHAGYNGFFLDNANIWTISRQSTEYVNKVKQFNADLKALGLAFMPYSLGQGEPSMMSWDHTCAFPVRGTPMVVSSGKATVKKDPSLGFVNGGMETLADLTPANWKFAGIAPNQNFFIDSTEVRSGKYAVRIEQVSGGTVTLSQNLTVKPWRTYKVKVWLKTKGLSSTKGLAFAVVGSMRQIVKDKGNDRVNPNGGWFVHSVDFPSLKNSAVKIIFTAWPSTNKKGVVWVDDVSVEETGLYELHMGRPSLEVAVKSSDGKTTYARGKDYNFSYQLERHYQSTLNIPSGSAIKEGQELEVDWYVLGDVHSIVYPSASFCSEGTWTAMRGNVKALHDAIGPIPGWFNKLSEWRNGNWDPSCPTIYANLSEYQGKTQRRCVELLREYSPKVENYIWNDAFDPYHNGLGPYQINNGELVNGWAHLHPETIILNWNEGKKEKSVRFFSGMDPEYPNVFYHQLLSFWTTSGPTQWLDILDKLEKEGMHKHAVVGFQYTSWVANDYTKITSFADKAKAAGRWGSNKDPFQPIERPGIAASPCPGRHHANLTAGTPTRHGTASVSFSLPQKGAVRLTVVDALGRNAGNLVNETRPAGRHKANWDTRNLPSGVYFLFLDLEQQGSPQRITQKIFLP